LTSSKRQNCKDFFTNRVLDWNRMIQYIHSAFALTVTFGAAHAAGRGTSMKLHGWNVKPLKPRISPSAKDEPLAEDIFVNSIVAVKDNKRVLLHRVVKINPDGSEEVFIIKASPKIIETNH